MADPIFEDALADYKVFGVKPDFGLSTNQYGWLDKIKYHIYVLYLRLMG
jgi:hypothetical protein